ncbi:MAG: hypothetical protein M0R17_09050 [Candidatus Omnitrophica bacterium]|jgi:hypothetical protein|nr:hypothetical protein [Candidatus Omnitrophota bacterium]
MDNPIKIAVTGSSNFEYKDFVKKLLLKLKEKCGDDLQIGTGGRLHGADKHIKSFCTKLNIILVEFNPCHETKSLYSYHDTRYFNKEFNILNYFKRNKELVVWADKIFILKNKKDTTVDINNLIKLADKSLKLAKIYTHND